MSGSEDGGKLVSSSEHSRSAAVTSHLHSLAFRRLITTGSKLAQPRLLES